MKFIEGNNFPSLSSNDRGGGSSAIPISTQRRSPLEENGLKEGNLAFVESDSSSKEMYTDFLSMNYACLNAKKIIEEQAFSRAAEKATLEASLASLMGNLSLQSGKVSREATLEASPCSKLMKMATEEPKQAEKGFSFMDEARKSVEEQYSPSRISNDDCVVLTLVPMSIQKPSSLERKGSKEENHIFSESRDSDEEMDPNFLTIHSGRMNAEKITEEIILAAAEKARKVKESRHATLEASLPNRVSYGSTRAMNNEPLVNLAREESEDPKQTKSDEEMDPNFRTINYLNAKKMTEEQTSTGAEKAGDRNESEEARLGEAVLAIAASLPTQVRQNPPSKPLSDEQLAQMVREDPKKAKRIINNRLSAMRAKNRKKQYTKTLEQKREALLSESNDLSAQFFCLQAETKALHSEIAKMKEKLHIVMPRLKLQDSINDQMQAEIHHWKTINERNSIAPVDVHQHQQIHQFMPM